MGFLDLIFGARDRNNPVLESVLKMVNDPQSGGLEGLVQSFRDKGLEGLVNSWVSTGQNLPISADQIQQALGSDRLGQLAGNLGLSNADLSSKLAEILPNVVDKLTPNGQVPDANALGQLLGSLRGKLG